MNGVAFLVVLAASAHSLCAQLTVTATGTLTAYRNQMGIVTQASQPVSGSTNLSVGYGTIDLSLGPTTTVSAFANSGSGPAPAVAEARADVVLLHGSAAPMAGLLRFTRTSGPGIATVSVDVEGDGLFELPSWAPGPIDVPVVLGPIPLAIEVDVQVVTLLSTTASASLTVQFLPQANLSTSGAGCGATISASMLKSTATADGRLWLHFHEQPFGSDFAAVLFGVTPLPMGVTCGPGLDEGWFFVTPSPTGVHLPIVLSTGGLGSAYVQYVGLQLPDQLRWSNRIGLTLP